MFDYKQRITDSAYIYCFVCVHATCKKYFELISNIIHFLNVSENEHENVFYFPSRQFFLVTVGRSVIALRTSYYTKAVCWNVIIIIIVIILIHILGASICDDWLMYVFNQIKTHDSLTHLLWLKRKKIFPQKSFCWQYDNQAMKITIKSERSASLWLTFSKYIFHTFCL